MEKDIIATGASWKHEPFGATRPIPYRRAFTVAEFSRLRRGLVPEVTEDKWFIYFEEWRCFCIAAGPGWRSIASIWLKTGKAPW
ncbi:hypothetical protein OF829_17915 [Sphingomonas sp. LB-2]|uniref:hypothetical protein n=1 Tax=Sphingomonas caeni TaxID=2984949 RepID=UPI0022321689|nr:hypothetical protein [Sphingomonas caeni]MCW3849120.1 hypothetical protein [Sphingomonas caeni]